MGDRESLASIKENGPERRKKVGNYILGKILGEGSFSKVRQGIHLIARERVAVKIVPKKAMVLREYVRKNVRREAIMLQRLDHPNIVRLYEIMETGNSYYLVLELAERGEFIKYLSERQKLCEPECRKYMRQIASAVDHMHTSNIVHRNLKLENLLLDRAHNIKIIDFGLSNVYFGESSLTTQCGSAAYTAPEVLANKSYGPAVDIWSMGVCLYAMVSGQLPFVTTPTSNIALLHAIIMKGCKIPEGISEDCVDLILGMLKPDDKFRFCIEDLFIHPWIMEGYDEPLLTRQPILGKLFPSIPKSTLVNYMTKIFNFCEDDVFKSVIERKSNAIAATYHLLLKRYESGQNLVGFSTEMQGSGISVLRKRSDASLLSASSRTELPDLSEYGFSNEMINAGPQSAKQNAYKDFASILKESKQKQTSLQRDNIIRRRKSRLLIKPPLYRSEDILDQGIQPDFILTYNTNDHDHDNENALNQRYEWEQGFVSKREDARSAKSSVNISLQEVEESTEIDTQERAKTASLRTLPPTPPNTAKGKERPSANTHLAILPFRSYQAQNQKDKDKKLLSSEFSFDRTNSMDDQWDEDSSDSNSAKNRNRLVKGTTVGLSRSKTFTYANPISSPKALTPREAKYFFDDIHKTQVIGTSRKLVEREKVTKSEEIVAARKSKTAGSQRQLPEISQPLNVRHSYQTEPTLLETASKLGRPLPVPNVEADDKQTFVDGVMDVIKVHITSSSKAVSDV